MWQSELAGLKTLYVSGPSCSGGTDQTTWQLVASMTPPTGKYWIVYGIHKYHHGGTTTTGYSANASSYVRVVWEDNTTTDVALEEDVHISDVTVDAAELTKAAGKFKRVKEIRLYARQVTDQGATVSASVRLAATEVPI